MKHINVRFLQILPVVAILIAAVPGQTQIPDLMNYQGRLTDPTGTPVVDGAYSAIFRIYDETSTLRWSETHNVNTTDGLFSVRLGSNGSPLTQDIFDYPECWLGITVGADPELTPRARLTTVPYAFKAIQADTAGHSLTIADGSVTTGKISDGTVGFIDINQNGATPGQIMKWNGSAWVADNESAGGSAGWVDDGNTVRLETVGDSVGIGTVSPSEKLDIVGNIAASGKATIGPGHTNSGNNAVVVGGNNTATGDNTFVAGTGNTTSGIYSVVVGGDLNTASGEGAAIGGGRMNLVEGFSSAICGGYADTITATADYSYLFGIRSNLTEDSTFMVDMPHIRFGDEVDGYEFPPSDGAADQMLATDGSGHVGWTDAPGGSNWTVSGSVLYTRQYRGIARGGASNILHGGYTHTMVNLGVGCTTGSEEGDVHYAAVSGGLGNVAGGNYAAVAGGYHCTASGSSTAVGGGVYNEASGIRSTIAGGYTNTASGDCATIGGGVVNEANGVRSTVAGGNDNIANGDWSTIGGGYGNTANGYYSTVPGGMDCESSGDLSFAAGKRAKATHDGSFVWADAGNYDFNSSAEDRFHVRASGGTYIYSNHLSTAGVRLSSGSSSWTTVSDSTLKRNIREVDCQNVLQKVAELPVSQWSYRTQDESVEHVGPMAQDFHRLFGLGEDDKHINTLDPDGIALAAIKGLYELNREQATQIEKLKAQLNARRNRESAEISELKAKLSRLTRSVDDLLARLNSAGGVGLAATD